MKSEKLFNISDKVVFLTGSAGQLGQVITNALLLNNAKVIASDNSEKMLMLASRENGWENNPNLLIKNCDIKNYDSVENLMDEGASYFGKITNLICNAATSVFEPFLDRPESSIDLVMDVNLKGTLFCIQNFLKYKKSQLDIGISEPSSIVNIASHYGVVSPDYRIYTDCERKNSEIYGATKAGIIQMTKFFATHAVDFNTRSNAISPGGILNEKNPQGEDFRKRYSEKCPLKRMSNANEIIGATIFLLSDASSYVNGHNLIVDGGFSVW